MPDIDEPTGAGRLWRLSKDLGAAARQYRTDYLRVLSRAVRLRVQHGFLPREALGCGLLDPCVARDVEAACIPKGRLMAHQRRFNPISWAALLEDKAVFYAYCAALNLPVPTLYAVFDRPNGWAPAGVILRCRKDWERFFNESLPDTFVVKPADGYYGLGLSVYRRCPEGFQDTKGIIRTASALYDVLRTDATHRRFVIQERLFNHVDLARLSGTPALQTVRLVTWIGGDGDVETCLTWLRIIVGENANDNFVFGRTGNLLANISLEDGTLGPALGAETNGVGFKVIDQHPVTGAAISGLRLPFWEDAQQLVCRAARLFLPLRTIGWDVALTPVGPFLVEGNMWWDPCNHLMVGPQASGSQRRGARSLLKHLAGPDAALR